MWRSRMFWQLFGTYGVLILFSVGLLGFVVGSQAERAELADIGIPEKAASLQRLIWTAAAVTGLLALAMAFWIAQRIAHPIRELTHGAEEIAAGAYGHRVYVEGDAEVGKLTRTFNHMSVRLAAQFAQLDADRQQLRTVLSSMVEGVVAVDAEQRVLFANERAGQLLEFDTRSAVGRYLWELVRHRSIHELIRGALAQGTHRSQELTWNGPGMRSLTVHVARLPATPRPAAEQNGEAGAAAGSDAGVVLVFHDNTELRRLERMRQEFVANVSHELKTPLAVIQATVETLIDGAIDDASHRGPFLERIADQAGRLHNLILDLLRLARIESATEGFTREALELNLIVQECLDKHRTLAEGKRQRLEAVPPPPEQTPAIAWADEEAVQQILDNLVDNAIKYTPEGGLIHVRWGRELDKVLFEIKDSGIGIAEADLPRIFERFYRVDKARSRELGGTGLGLSIVKHLAQAMHGQVRASSQLGAGSTFTVYLPAVLGANDVHS